MRGLLPYAWRGLAARPARTSLTVLGIAIGVGVLVAALATSAGLDASIERSVTSIVGRADLRVAAFAETGLSAATIEALDGVPGVATVAPAIERRAFLVSEPGRPVVTAPVTVLGVDAAREPAVRDLVLAAGALLTDAAAGPSGGALVTERLAAEEGLELGGSVSILGAGAPAHLTITGLLAGDGPETGSGGRTVVVPLAVARALATGEPLPAAGAPVAPIDGLTRADVVLATGADPQAVIGAIEDALVTEPYVVSRPQDIAASMRASTADIRGTMALLASITLFAAAFLVLNATAMTVVERVRELGLLRAAGATRGQLVRLVELQALAVGTAGSLLGIALGIGLADAVAAWLRAGGVRLDGPALTPAIPVAGLAVGVLITLVAALEPARRAGSVSPVTALRSRSDPASAARAHTGWLIVVIGVAGAIAVLLLPAGGGAAGPVRAVAVYALLLLAVLVTPVFLVPLGRLAGLPFALVLRLEERLARAALGRDRTRTTATVGALVVGLAMVVALASVGANARTAATAWLSDVVPGDEVLTAIAPAPVGDGGVDEQLADLPGVERATAIASFDLAFEGTRLEATAVSGAGMAADGRLTFVSGDRSAALAALDDGGAVILPRSRAERLGVETGGLLVVAGTAGPVELRVAGVVERTFPGRSGETVLVGWPDATGRFGVTGADAFAVRYAPGARPSASVAVAEVARSYALTVAPIEQVEGAVGDALDRVFGLLDLLAAAAVLVAALGIVNTMSMDTWERVRELGMLRAAGMSRNQAWRSVLVEAGVLGLIGSVVGCGAGVVVGVLLVATAGGRADAAIALPWPTIAGGLVVGVALAMLAAAQPARVAGRRSIVAAVRGE